MQTIEFPKYTGVRCLMMPYVQGEPYSVPVEFAAYRNIVSEVFLRRGDIGFLTIDESVAVAGKPHRGARARYERALHTEAGLVEDVARWGGQRPGWGGRAAVMLEHDVKVLLASNVDNSCAVWHAEHVDTTEDGDIGHVASQYPYDTATILKAGEVCEIGIFTPHESLPIKRDVHRQFLRIVGSGVHGREDYFTVNPLVPLHRRTA